MEYRQSISDLVPRLRRYARALVGRSSLADDLVRNTVQRALELLPRLRREPDLRIWLFSIMHDTYVETLYRTPGAAAIHSSTSGGGAEDASRAHFERAIHELPHEQREVFLLITLEDMTYEDAARTLDIPIGTVMSRLSRAREKLRVMLINQARLKRVK
jgi:RNA polymerase sigma-70 factor (ECF subfamily)